MGRRSTTRRLFLALLAAALVLTHDARAEDAVVPLKLQASLLAKVAKYDKHMADRAGGALRVLIVKLAGNGESERAAQQLERHLDDLTDIGGFQREVSILQYQTASALAATIRDRKIAIVYLTPGFGSALDDVTHALDGIDVLSVSAVPSHVERGIVLGFDLESSKPILLVNLAAAKRQNVAFDPKVLKLMKVYR